MTSALDQLQAWYLSQCDGDWEHDSIVRITTLDNPGWQVRIDLAGTRWAGAEFTVTQHDTSDHDWVRCWVAGTEWHAAAGPCNLDEAIRIFLAWIEADAAPAPRGLAVDEWLRKRWVEREALSDDADSASEGSGT